MIAALFFLGIILFFAYARVKLPADALLGLVWLIGVWALTFASHYQTGFVSPDEIYFSTEKLDSLLQNRSLWLVINSATGLFTDDIIFEMRIFNLGFVVLLYVLAVTRLRSIPPILIAICLSYAGCVAALNLRDVAILFVALHILTALGMSSSNIRDLIATTWREKSAVLFLFMLRPQMLILLLSSALRFRILVVIILGSVAFLQSGLGTKYFYNYAYYSQNFSTAIVERAEEKEYDRTEPNLVNIAYWTARFIFAPDPISSSRRLITEPETHPYGTFDLAIRTVSRFSLYTLLVLILHRAVTAPRRTWQVLSQHAFALKFGLLFSLLYALFNFGASHERVKMVVLVLLLYLFDKLRAAFRERKKTKRADVSHPHKLAQLR